MEVRANYILVGLFALTLLIGGLAFSIWLAHSNQNADMQLWDISMRESVMGLSVNNDVLFNGVPVGKVEQINISKTDPNAVVVRVNIFASTPIREDSQAALVMRGVTGIFLVNIMGGTERSPLVSVPNGEVGIIHFRPSPLSAMTQSLPDTLAKVNHLLARMEQIASEDNIRAIHATTASVAELTTTLAKHAVNMENTLKYTESTAKGLHDLTTKANALMQEIEPGVQRLSKDGVADMHMLMIESRTLVQTLSRIAQRMESDPRSFIFGNQTEEYTP